MTPARSEDSESLNLQQSGNGVFVYGTSFNVGSNYEIVHPLGQGAYGVVVAAKVKHLNEDGTAADVEQADNDEHSGDDSEGRVSEMVAIKKIML